MNNKVLVPLVVIGSILVFSGISHAESLEEAITLYLEDPSLDWLGRDFDKILFNESIRANQGMKLSDGELIAKLKFIIEDIKTMPLQLKAYHKIFTNKVNIIGYGSLAGIWGARVSLTGEQFSRILMNLLKLTYRQF